MGEGGYLGEEAKEETKNKQKGRATFSPQSSANSSSETVGNCSATQARKVSTSEERKKKKERSTRGEDGEGKRKKPAGFLPSRHSPDG